MRDIYLIDFENVASEGLSGITYLSEDDQVIIFYSNNSNRLTMKMHILIGKSVCNLSYFEVTVGGKNALDHQISTYLGYLMGTNAAERNYYIVSRDMGYKHVANFWASQRIGPKIRCIDTIKGASRLERNRKEPVLQAVPQEPAPELPVPEIQEPLLPETTASLPPVEPVVSEDTILDTAPHTPSEAPSSEAAGPSVSLLPPEPTPEPLQEPLILVAEPAEPEAAASQSQEPELQEPQVSAEPEVTAPAEPRPEPQRRINRNRPRPRGRYRKNSSPASETKFPPQESPEEQPAPAENQPEPQEKKPELKEALPEAQEKKPESAEKKPEPKKKSGAKKAGTPKQDSANLDQLSSLIAPYPKLQENVLRDLIANNKRQVLCNTLRKHLGQEKGLALYNEIKKSAWH